MSTLSPIKLTLGRLEKVDLRNCWSREDSDFTPWLAEAENIRLLGDTIGLELEVEAQEKGVGLFRADILCKDTLTENWVLIENQLERTDHIHLGQLLTYAAGLNAVTIVWIAERFTEEHRAALDWLNEMTDEAVNFFGLEIELWRIGESAIAPKLNVVCQPNNWSRSVTGAAKNLQNSVPTETRQLQCEYWEAFRSYALECATRIKPIKALPQNWMDISLGRSGFKLSAIAGVGSGEIRAEIHITHDEAKSFFKLLELEKAQIEEEFGETLIWYNDPEKKGCKMLVRCMVDVNDRSEWQTQHQWLVEKLDKLHQVFSNRVKQLNPS